MVRLYLDIETYRKNKPFINEKIIAIGVIEDWTRYNKFSAYDINSNVEFKMFSEWKLGSEEQVVRKFYEYFENLINEAKFLDVIGFNILRFDIPLLIQKGVEFNVKTLDQLNKLWNDTFTIDLFQIALPTNNMMFKGNTLDRLAMVAKSYGINIPPSHGSGKDVAIWYEEKKYDEIEQHLKRDLEIIRILERSGVLMKMLKNANNL